MSYNMMYQYWLKDKKKNKEVRMTRRFGEIDYPTGNDNIANTNTVEGYSTRSAANDLDPREHKTKSRINNVYSTIPDNAVTYVGLMYPYLSKYPMDYPDNYFHESNTPLVLHFRGQDERELPPEQTILNYKPYHAVHDLGNLDYHNTREREATLQDVHNFIINQLAKKAALIMHSAHPGGTGARFSPAADYFEEFEGHMPKFLQQATQQPHLSDLPSGVAAVAHQLSHLHNDFITHGVSENNPNLHHYLSRVLESHKNDHPYTKFLQLIHQGLSG